MKKYIKKFAMFLATKPWINRVFNAFMFYIVGFIIIRNTYEPIEFLYLAIASLIQLFL